MISRQETRLLSKLKCVEKGLLIKTKRNETERKVKYEYKKRKGVEQRKSKISKNQWDVLSGSGDNEEVFESFQSELQNDKETWSHVGLDFTVTKRDDRRMDGEDISRVYNGLRLVV